MVCPTTQGDHKKDRTVVMQSRLPDGGFSRFDKRTIPMQRVTDGQI